MTWSIGADSVLEELLEPVGVGGVEGRGAHGAELAGRALEALGVAAGEDDVGALGARPPGGLEPDAGAAADHDDGLAEQFRRALCGSCGGHRSSPSGSSPGDQVEVVAEVEGMSSYSSWSLYQRPDSLRPSGARSSHWNMFQSTCTPRAYAEYVWVDDAVLQPERTHPLRVEPRGFVQRRHLLGACRRPREL